MDQDVFFQMLMPLNLGLFGAMFLSIYFYEKRLTFTGWIGLGFMSGMLASAIDIFQSKIDWGPFYFDDFSNPLFWTVGACFTFGLALRYRHPFPLRTIAALYALGMTSQLYFRHLNPMMWAQESIANIVAGSILLCASYLVWQKAKDGIDKILWIVFAGAGISNFLRIIVVFGVIDPEFNAESYTESLHASAQLFTSAIFAALGAFSLMVLCALDLVNIYRSESKTDSLTGLPNRRGLDEYIGALDPDKGLAGHHLIVCDLDNFKDINDTYGHHAGDMVLRRIGETVSTLVQSFGIAARIGGEEFVVLVRPIESEATRFVADQLCHALRQLHHPELPEDLKVTASFGIARVEDSESYTDVYKRADTALYAAKADGRNRVMEAKPADQDTGSIKKPA